MKLVELVWLPMELVEFFWVPMKLVKLFESVPVLAVASLWSGGREDDGPYASFGSWIEPFSARPDSAGPLGHVARYSHNSEVDVVRAVDALRYEYGALITKNPGLVSTGPTYSTTSATVNRMLSHAFAWNRVHFTSVVVASYVLNIRVFLKI